MLNLTLVIRDHYLAQSPANSSALCDYQHHKLLGGCTYSNYVAIAMWYFVKNCGVRHLVSDEGSIEEK